MFKDKIIKKHKSELKDKSCPFCELKSLVIINCIDDFVTDGDLVRCPKCGEIGYIFIDSEEKISIIWFSEIL